MKLEQNRLDPIPRSENDITVIFIRGNGIPRTFKLTIRSLRRSVLLFSSAFGLTVLVAVLGFGLYFFSAAGPTLNPLKLPKEEIRYVTVTATSLATATATSTAVATSAKTSTGAVAATTVTVTATQTVTVTAVASAIATATATATTVTTAELPKPGIFARLFSKSPSKVPTPEPTPVKPEGKSPSDLKPELDKSDPVAQLLASYTRESSPEEANVKIRNAKIFADEEQKKVTLTFELQNAHPEQRQARGHIIVFAQSAKNLFVYPRYAYAAKEKRPLSHTKGETFAISYGRQATATFNDIDLEKESFQFQIVLFSSEGKIISSEMVENK